MDLIPVILIAVGLAMDAFAVSICKGLAMRRPDIGEMLAVGLWFGIFQAVMPLIGYALGSSMYDMISDYDHWIAFGLLALIGANMIREGISHEEEELDASLDFITMLILAVATSIDAFAVGITFAMDGTSIVPASAIIGIVTLVISMIGVGIGAKVGGAFGKKAEILGGIILIAIGIKVVLEHTGVL